MDWIKNCLEDFILECDASRELYFCEDVQKHKFAEIVDEDLLVYIKSITRFRESYTTQHGNLFFEAAKQSIDCFAFLLCAQQDNPLFSRHFVQFLVLLHLQVKNTSELIYKHLQTLPQDTFYHLNLYLIHYPEINLQVPEIKQLFDLKKTFRLQNSQILCTYTTQPFEITTEQIELLQSGPCKQLRAALSAVFIAVSAGLTPALKMIEKIDNFYLKFGILAEILYRLDLQSQLEFVQKVVNLSVAEQVQEGQEQESFLALLKQPHEFDFSPVRHVSEVVDGYVNEVIEVDKFALPLSQFIFVAFPDGFK